MITGTSRGLGAELARLAHDRFGAAVLGIDRSEPSQVGMYEHVRADLATAEGRERAVVALHEWKPTVLVNCAMTNQSRRVVDTSAALTDEIIGVGFTTPFTLMREMALSRSQSDDDAWVINIVSPYRLVGVRTHSLYCAVKAALSRAGESLGVEVPQNGPLTVVSVVPGAFHSGFRPLEPHDAWLVRTYRTLRRQGPEEVAANLVSRLERGTTRRHWTIRLGFDGPAFEVLARALESDIFLVALDRLIGQRPAPSSTRNQAETAHARTGAAR